MVLLADPTHTQTHANLCASVLLIIKSKNSPNLTIIYYETTFGQPPLFKNPINLQIFCLFFHLPSSSSAALSSSENLIRIYFTFFVCVSVGACVVSHKFIASPVSIRSPHSVCHLLCFVGVCVLLCGKCVQVKCDVMLGLCGSARPHQVHRAVCGWF